MSKICIITDSGSDITQEEAKKLGIVVLPIAVRFNEDVYFDGVNLSKDEFYHKLIESDVLPKTAQITPFAYEEAFNKAIENGQEVLCLPLSSKISGSYGNAVQAANNNPHIRVVDSLSACLGQYILIKRACELRDEGLTLDQLALEIEKETKNVCLIALLDTLEFLKKGGRISNLSAFLGSMLAIKPVVSIIDGRVEVIGKARGSKNGKNMLRELVEKEGGINFKKPHVASYSGLSQEVLKKYIDDNKDLYIDSISDMPITQIGPTIGTHIGPGTIAFAFFKK